MNETLLQDKEHWQKLALDIYKKIPANRGYALTPQAAVALGALAKAWREAGKSFAGDGPDQFSKFLRFEVGPLVGSLFQEQASDPPELPKPWIDPVTGAQLPNPWLTNDAKARLLLGKRD